MVWMNWSQMIGESVLEFDLLGRGGETLQVCLVLLPEVEVEGVAVVLRKFSGHFQTGLPLLLTSGVEQDGEQGLLVAGLFVAEGVGLQ
jgi:hypothetical protein